MTTTELDQIPPVLSQKGRPIASERFSDAELGLLMEAFSRRFMDVFDDASQSDIARQLNTTQGTVREYIHGRRFPTAEILITIARRKGISLDWLLEGKGRKWQIPLEDIFSEEEERDIRDLANAAGRSYEEQIRVLTTAALELGRKI